MGRIVADPGRGVDRIGQRRPIAFDVAHPEHCPATHAAQPQQSAATVHSAPFGEHAHEPPVHVPLQQSPSPVHAACGGLQHAKL